VTTQPTLPPQLAARMLAALLPEFSRDAILGDLHENFAQIELEQGTAAARRWYWGETLGALPGFALHSLRTTGLRRQQAVIGNMWNDNWFGKQDSRLVAGIGFFFVLPALLVIGLAFIYFTFGPATATAIPGATQVIGWMESGWLTIGSLRLPVGILMLVGLALAGLINVLALVQIKIESLKDSFRFSFTIKRQFWNLLLLGLIVLLGLGMDKLIS
jgi:hypothetical protein